MYTLLVIAQLQFIILNAEWILMSTTMPREDYAMAIGSYNQSIFILGGGLAVKQLIEYNIPEDSFTDYKEKHFKAAISGDSTFYTQSDHILYIHHQTKASLSIFNLQTKEFTSDYIEPTTNAQIYGSACLTSTTDSLFSIGGWDWYPTVVGTVQMLDLITHQWSHHIPSLKQPRVLHSCIINPSTNVLYAIAGSADGFTTALSSIERIDTNNIDQHTTWTYISPLTIAVAYTTAVIHHNIIYILGGADFVGAGFTYYDTVHLIDTTTNQVAIAVDPLPFAMSDVTPIIVNDVLYVFGGIGLNDYVKDTLVIYPLASTSTTNVPTVITATDQRTTLHLTEHVQTTSMNPAISSTPFVSTTADLPSKPRTSSENVVTTESITSNPSVYPTVSPITEDPTITIQTGSPEFVDQSTTDESKEAPNRGSDHDNDNSNSFEMKSFATSVNGILLIITLVLVLFLGIAVIALCVIKRAVGIQRVTQDFNELVGANSPKSLPIEKVNNDVMFEGNETINGRQIVDDYKHDIEMDGNVAIAAPDTVDEMDDGLNTGTATMEALPAAISADSGDDDSDDDVLLEGDITMKAPAAVVVADDEDDEYIPPPPPPPPVMDNNLFMD